MFKTIKSKTLLVGTLFAASLVVKADSPLIGTWYNSYCSQVVLSVDASTGVITGEYTSHTGSTGTSNVVGYIDPGASASSGQTNPNGIPFSIGIQWRLINSDISNADGSWHWVSSFAGQYHPAQTVSADNQDDYSIDETLELLNGLLATATVSGFADDAPVLWPQTLHFNRTAPSYCQDVTPAQPVTYSTNADDNISGQWRNQAGDILSLTASLSDGSVTGTLIPFHGSEKYKVVGLFDVLDPSQTSASNVVWQGVALALYDSSDKKLKVMAGGVDYDNFGAMYLYSGDLQSTTWTDRFIQETLDKDTWTKSGY